MKLGDIAASIVRRGGVPSEPEEHVHGCFKESLLGLANGFLKIP